MTKRLVSLAVLLMLAAGAVGCIDIEDDDDSRMIREQVEQLDSAPADATDDM